MQIAGCIVAASPMRKESSHRSEMVSQLLLGEFAEVLDETKDFIKVKALHDGYEGWCQRSQMVEVEKAEITTRYASNGIDLVHINGQLTFVSIATPVYGSCIKLNNYAIDYNHLAIVDAKEYPFTEENIIFMSYKYINVPYLWGGRSLFGIDCSGFSQQVYKMFNKHLPRDAYQQAELGEVVGFLQEAKCGDLAFFDNDEGRIVHVGIMLSNEEIIHSAGRVRVDKIDNQGIINTDTGERTHKLRIIKRYV
ncbi:NlpC/P60 family protein [Chitinophagaceae bacterium LWZ2-11]